MNLFFAAEMLGVLGVLLMQVVVFMRLRRHDHLDAHTNYLLGAVDKSHTRVQELLREEATRQAEAARQSGLQQRQDTHVVIENLGRLLTEQMMQTAAGQNALLDTFVQQLAHLSENMDGKMETMRTAMDGRMNQFAVIIRDNGSHDRSESKGNFDNFREGMLGRFDMHTTRMKAQLEGVQTILSTAALHNADQIDSMRDDMQRRLSQAQTDMFAANASGREEMATSFKYLSDILLSQMTRMADAQHQQLERTEVAVHGLMTANESKLERLREVVDTRLQSMQVDNSSKLEQMRHTVDEKLHATLERRLGESFDYVSERLELVHQGLNEMQTLTRGVADLRRVIADTKVRGNWGEVKLSNLLEQMLTPEQYVVKAMLHPMSTDPVDFAVVLPGREMDAAPVLLPIDASFPQADFQRLVEAHERGDAAATALAATDLEACVLAQAQRVGATLKVPYTTDFAIMFLPTEGLFAEVLRRPGLCERIMLEHRVVLAGPTTLSATLSSLQMGFRVHTIELRSSEVWHLLGAIKSEFSKFGMALDSVHKKLQEAGSTIEEARTRQRVMDRSLQDVKPLPARETQRVMGVIDISHELASEHGYDASQEVSMPAAGHTYTRTDKF